MWFFIALLNPIFHGGANVLDNYFTNSIFKRTSTLAFFAAFLNFLFLPFVIFISPPHLLPLSLLPLAALLGLIDILYLFPYYKALQEEDTSIVTAFFSLGNVLVPILAFFLVHERLAPLQYAGFFIVIIASAAFGFRRGARFKMSAAFFYMLAVSILLSLEIVIYKYLFESVDWGTGFVWSTLFSFIFALVPLVFPKIRKDISENFHHFRKSLPIFAAEEFLTFAGSAAGTFAVSLASVTLVEGVAQLQAIIVVLYAVLFRKFVPKLFKEETDRKTLVKKMSLFFIMIVGAWLCIKEFL